MKCLFPEGHGWIAAGPYVYAGWSPIHPNKIMNDAGISCDTCFYRSPYKGCSLDSHECLGPKTPWKYNLWVERVRSVNHLKHGDDCYDNYFDAGGEALKKEIDDDILKNIAKDAETKDKSTLKVLCDLGGIFCVVYTFITLAVLGITGLLSVIFWMVD
jgi:hypothetical protein